MSNFVTNRLALSCILTSDSYAIYYVINHVGGRLFLILKQIKVESLYN